MVYFHALSTACLSVSSIVPLWPCYAILLCMRLALFADAFFFCTSSIACHTFVCFMQPVSPYILNAFTRHSSQISFFFLSVCVPRPVISQKFRTVSVCILDRKLRSDQFRSVWQLSYSRMTFGIASQIRCNFKLCHCFWSLAVQWTPLLRDLPL